MKFIIYGAGKRGKEELESLGKNKVIAFVDNNPNKVGTEYCGLPVISIESLNDFNEQIICILSPAEGIQEIINHITEKGVNNYIPIQSFDRMLFYKKSSLFSMIAMKYKDNDLGIYGISAGSITLYEYLKENTKNNIFLVSDIDKSIEKNLRNQGYSILCNEKEIKELDVVINTKKELSQNLKNLLKEDCKIIQCQEIFEDCFQGYNRQITQYKNIHLNERCFIIATGPSLNSQDLDILYKHKEKCISMNRIYNIFNQTNWRPDYYLIEDTKMIEDLQEEIAKLEVPVKFVPSIPESYWEQKELGNSIKYHLSILNVGEELPYFSENIDKCIYEGSTVTYACLQLAAYMGFKEIILLGVDFNYSKNLYDETNHFKGYQSDKVVRLNSVNINRMEAAYKSAKMYAEQNGVKILNATRGGKLEVFERVNFDDLFK